MKVITAKTAAFKEDAFRKYVRMRLGL